MIFPKWLRVLKVRAGDITFPKGHNRITVTHVEQISDAFVRIIGIRTRDAKHVQMTLSIKRRMIVIRENVDAPAAVVESSPQPAAQPMPGVRVGPVLLREVAPVSVLRRDGDVRDVPRDAAGGPASAGGLWTNVDYSADTFAPNDVPTFTRLQAVYPSQTTQEAPGAVRVVRAPLDSAGGVRPPSVGGGGMVHHVRETLRHGDGSSIRDDWAFAGSGGTPLTAADLVANLRSLNL